MQKGSLVYYHGDTDQNKRLYIVYGVEENLFLYTRARINVVCCQTAKRFWFFRSDLRVLK